MRQLLIIFLPVLFFALCGAIYEQRAFAEGTSSGPTTNSSQASDRNAHLSRRGGNAERVVNQVGSGKTYMMVDEKNNRIKIIVEGKDVAYFHKGGLHVDGAITSSTSPVK